MISISVRLHMKRHHTQLSLKSSAQTHSEPWKQLQYSVRVPPPYSLYLWPSTNQSSLWTSGSTLSNEEFKNEWSQFWIQVTASWIIVTWVSQCSYALGMIETMGDGRDTLIPVECITAVGQSDLNWKWQWWQTDREFGMREHHYHQAGLLNRPSILNLH